MSLPQRRDFVERLAAVPGREDRLTHVEVVPERAGRRADWPVWTSPELVAAWRARGIGQPWVHQVEAAELVHAGTHTVVSTGTASGKSLAYLMPALTDVLASLGPRGRRGATVLYLSPTKALAQD